MKKETWKTLIQILVSILTAIGTTLGVTSCMASAISIKRGCGFRFFRCETRTKYIPLPYSKLTSRASWGCSGRQLHGMERL